MAGTVTLDVFTGAKIALVPATEKSPGSISSQFTSTEQSLGTITWTGTPPVVSVKSWRTSQSGNLASISGYIKCSTAGLLVSQLSVPFPTGAPQPWLPAGQESDEWVANGTGCILQSKSSALASGHSSGIYKTSTGDLIITVSTGGVTVGAKYARFYIPYLVGD